MKVAMIGNPSEGWRIVGPMTDDQADAWEPADGGDAWFVTLEPYRGPTLGLRELAERIIRTNAADPLELDAKTIAEDAVELACLVLAEQGE